MVILPSLRRRERGERNVSQSKPKEKEPQSRRPFPVFFAFLEKETNKNSDFSIVVLVDISC